MSVFQGVWDPYKVYVGTQVEDPNNPGQLIERPGGADVVLWQGARWVANYYHTGINPMADTPGDSGRWRLEEGSTVNYNPAPPQAPTGLTAGFTDNDEIALFWNPAYVPGVGEITHYNIYKDGVKVGVSTTTSFLVENLDASKTHSYSVEAVNGLPQDGFGTSPRAAISATTEAEQVFNGKYYSPFVDVTIPTTNIIELARDSDLRDMTLAFMQTNNDDLDANGHLIAGRVPTLAWGGISNTTLPTGAIIEQVQQLQALGGTITVAFGGYNGREPAVICAEYSVYLQSTAGGGMSKAAADAVAAKHLQSMYQSVIDTYGVDHLDFDIENAVFKLDENKKAAVIDNVEANHLRNLAINGLNADNPDLHISFTVATMPGGVNETPNGVNSSGFITSGGSGDVKAFIEQLKADGVDVDVMNIMAMDYFDGAAANPDMGANAISAAIAMHDLLVKTGIDAQVAITPMLGQNDANLGGSEGNEVFGLQDARDLVEFFQSTPWVAGIGSWQLTRDRANSVDTTANGNPSGNGADPVSYSTGVVQADFEFSHILERIGLWTPTGGKGQDTITGTAAANTLSGMDAADLLIGLGGNDTLIGGDGYDVLDGGAGNDALNGGVGYDTATYQSATGPVTVSLALAGAQNVGGGAGIDTLVSIENVRGSEGFGDTLTGNANNNVLTGFGGNDTLRGAAGQDTLLGGLGNDTLDGGPGNDRLDGGAGVDTATYYFATGGVTVSLATTLAQNTGGAGTDTLIGIENLNGSGFADTLTGGAGANTINGFAGNDRITGGNGADILIGGGGVDTFVFTAVTDSDAGAYDRITDLTLDDIVDLSAIDANSLASGNQAFTRIGNFDAFTAAGQMRLSSHDGVVTIDLNTDGDAEAEMIIYLPTGYATSAAGSDGWIL